MPQAKQIKNPRRNCLSVWIRTAATSFDRADDRAGLFGPAVKLGFIKALLVIGPSWATQSLADVVPISPVDDATADRIFAKYCTGDRRSADRPGVNYADTDIIDAARKLQRVSPYSYYFYAGPLKAYGLRGSPALPPRFPIVAGAAKNGARNAHSFLLQVCGEFRDRPTMIEEKVKWARSILLLPVTRQKSIEVKKPIWPQISAQAYLPFLELSEEVWNLKKADLVISGRAYLDFRIGRSATRLEQNQFPVEGTSICETKYIFKNYVEKHLLAGAKLGLGRYYEGMERDNAADIKREFTELMKRWADYKEGFEAFKSNCTTEETDHYYDFRGDSNFKHYSPESNGMIWTAASITNQCEYQNGAYTASDAIAKSSGDPDICNKYFREPFKYRWAGARAGLAAWLFRTQDLDTKFVDQGSRVTILPHFEPTSKPYSFRFGDETRAHSSFSGLFFDQSDMGFNFFLRAGQIGFAYERLRDAVNRHTNWYESGFDDGMGLKRDQAYSPFVASSYVMKESDGFTAPGTTVTAPSDGCKHWMFVFKVHKDNWYNAATLEKGSPVDFDRHWFDETSLGTDSLADREKAWDRLGTPLEGEFDSVLYLHNLTVDGTVDAGCGRGSP